MSVSRQFSKLRIYKRALMLQRKASFLTPMERVIQRIATRVLKARFDEAQLDTVVMVSERMVLGALLGIPAEEALSSSEVRKTLKKLGGSTGINWKPQVMIALRGWRQISDTQMEDLIGKIYTSGSQSAAYIAGKLVADPSISDVRNSIKGDDNLSDEKKEARIDQLRDLAIEKLQEKTRVIASTFKLKVENLAKDLVNSDPNALERNTESVFEEGGELTPSAVRGEIESLDSWGNDLSDADYFIKLIMFDGSRLAQNVREYVLPIIRDDLVGHFVKSTRKWSYGWAEDMMADPRSGMFINPPAWGSFKAAEYLREWVYTKVRTPQKFNQIANEMGGHRRAEVVGKDLVISGLRLGSALGGKSISFLMTFSFMNEEGRQFQSKIHNVYVNGTDLVIVNWTRNYRIAPSMISDIHYLNLKTEATYINRRIVAYPKFLESMFQNKLLENERWKKDLFAMMLTSQTFSRSLQAKLKKANEIRKNKHTNVPF